MLSPCQTLLKACNELTDSSSTYYPPLGATLLACYAGTQADTGSISMPRALSFRQHWQQLLENQGSAPELHPKVYEMSEEAAHMEWERQYLFTDEGAIVCRSSGGGDGNTCLSIRKVSLSLYSWD